MRYCSDGVFNAVYTYCNKEQWFEWREVCLCVTLVCGRFVACAAAFSAASGPKQNTLDVMKEFYGSLGGGEWTNRANWTATDNYCLFYGVACDLDYNVVVRPST